ADRQGQIDEGAARRHRDAGSAARGAGRQDQIDEGAARRDRLTAAAHAAGAKVRSMKELIAATWLAAAGCSSGGLFLPTSTDGLPTESVDLGVMDLARRPPDLTMRLPDLTTRPID